MTDNPPKNISDSTIASRGGWSPNFVTPPSAPPIYMTTAFDLESLEQLDAVAAGNEVGYIYTRDGNPNQEAFANDVALLEGAESGVTSASGMGALSAVLLSRLRPGDHVVAARLLYGRTLQLLNHFQNHRGIEITYVEINDFQQWKNSVRENTRLAIVESVSNPLLQVANLPEIVSALGGVPLLVDNTFCTPSLLRPVVYGATYVWHSASKYLNGHGDVMLGVVVGQRDEIRRVRSTISLFGMNANPMETWLASRGLRTLSLRMERVSSTALQIAQFLSEHPAIEDVFYPGLPEHPTYQVAKSVMRHGFGGMLSFRIINGRKGAGALIRALHNSIPFSPTLADARTTLSYPAGTSHKFMSTEERAACGVCDGLVRLSIGLEDPVDLQVEIAKALTIAAR